MPVPRSGLPWMVLGPHAVPEGPGDAFPVQLLGNRLRRFARRIVVEYAEDDHGLRRIDPPLAAHRHAFRIETPHHVIPKGIPATGFARLDTTAQAAPRLVGEVLEKESAHRALQADMQFIHFAFGERDDPHAGEARALVDM